MKLQSLTNVRPVKELGSQIIASPTSGNFKLTPEAASAMKVGAGDYVVITKDTSVEPNVHYALKGSYDEETGANGSKLASANKGGGGILSFSAAAAWQELDGDTDYNVHYNVGEPVEFEGMELFPLTFDKKEAKQVRKSSEKKEANTSATTEASQESNDVSDVDYEEAEDEGFEGI